MTDAVSREKVLAIIEEQFLKTVQHLRKDDNVLADSLSVGLFALRDCITFDIRALPPHAEGEGWQPIETAPRDGSTVYVAKYDKTWGWVLGYAHWEDIRGISGWIARGLFEPPGELGLGNPTHWRPIPAPPARATIKQEER